MAEEIGVVLRDDERNYYLLPKRTVEAARVPAENVAHLEEALPEVAGYAMRGGYQFAGLVDIGPSRPGGLVHSDGIWEAPPLWGHPQGTHIDSWR
jgi:hypothetical protein